MSIGDSGIGYKIDKKPLRGSTSPSGGPYGSELVAENIPSMMGFHFSVYRLVDSPPPDIQQLLTEPWPAALDQVKQGERIAVWQTGTDGLSWINQQVEEGRAVGTLGTGYPGAFFAPARHLLPVILHGPPAANETWVSGPTDILMPGWEGRTVIDRERANVCSPEEWLLLEVWDES